MSINASNVNRAKTADTLQHPIAKVEYYESPFHVPTHGLLVSWGILDPADIVYIPGETDITDVVFSTGDAALISGSNDGAGQAFENISALAIRPDDGQVYALKQDNTDRYYLYWWDGTEWSTGDTMQETAGALVGTNQGDIAFAKNGNFMVSFQDPKATVHTVQTLWHSGDKTTKVRTDHVNDWGRINRRQPLALSGDSDFVLAWADNYTYFPNYALKYETWIDSTQTWSSTVDLGSDNSLGVNSGVSQVDVDVDQTNGNIHFVSTNSNTAKFLTYNNTSEATWERVFDADSSGGSHRVDSPVLVCHPSNTGVQYMVFRHYVAGGVGESRVVFAERDNGVYTYEEIESSGTASPGITGNDARYPDLFVDPSGNLYVTYTMWNNDEDKHELMFRYRQSGESNFTTASGLIVSQNVDSVGAPSVDTAFYSPKFAKPAPGQDMSNMYVAWVDDIDPSAITDKRVFWSSGTTYSSEVSSPSIHVPQPTLGFLGNDRLLSHNWGNGAAFGLSGSDYFDVLWSGYFFADQDGDYDFIVNKDPSSTAELTVSSTTYSMPESLEVSPIQTVALLSGWSMFVYKYSELEKESYTSVIYRPPNSEYYRPISAGVTSPSGSFIQPVELEAIENIDGNFGINKSRQYTFKVPMKPVTQGLFGVGEALPRVTGTQISYFYDPGRSSYVMRKNTTPVTWTDTYLRIGRLIKISAGYQSRCIFADGAQCTNDDETITPLYQGSLCENYGLPFCPANTPTGTDYIQRFEGIITDLKTSRSEGKNYLEIECQDTMLFLQENIDKNYPDVLSYLNTGLIKFKPDTVNFITDVFEDPYKRPKAYDAWPISYALRDIFVKGGIDPSKIFGARTITSLLDPLLNLYVTSTNPLIDSNLDLINLSRNFYYGKSHIPGVPTVGEDDAEYIWKTNFGDEVNDIAKRIIDAYGYYLQMTNDGFVEVRQVGAVASTSTFPGYASVNDGNTTAGAYTRISTEPVSVIMTGYKFNINTVVDSGSGIATSSFRMTKDASPVRINLSGANIADKPNVWQNNYPYNILYGAFWGPGTGETWTNVNYTTTRYGFNLPSGLDISGFKFSVKSDSTRGIYALTGGQRKDFCPNISSDIYFGPGTYTSNRLDSFDLNATYLVKSGWRMSDHGLVDFSSRNYFEDVDFASEVSTTGGLYVLEVVTTGSNELLPTGVNAGRFVSLNSFRFGGTADPYPYYTLAISGISSEFFSGWSDIEAFGSTDRIYSDITLREKYASISLGNEETQKTKVEVYTTGGVLKVSKEIVQRSDKKTYSKQGPDKYNDFQSVIEILPWDLATEASSGGILDSYDEYRVDISTNNGGGEVRLESLDAFTGQARAFNYVFNTEENIKGFSIKSNYENLRNDVSVVGNKISTEIDPNTIDNPINPKNPSNIYTFSRAVSLNSIYDLNFEHNIGRQKDFLIFEPGITTQEHADWLARGTLVKYYRNRNGTSFETVGVPFIDPLDSVLVVDHALETLQFNDQEQFIDSVSESISEGKYMMNIETTPYAPWSSFSQDIVNPVETDDEAFVDITITRLTKSDDRLVWGDPVQFDGGNHPGRGDNIKTDFLAIATGYNVYEGEKTTGIAERVKIRYVQMMAGFTTVKVLTPEGILVALLVGDFINGEVVPVPRNVGTVPALTWDGIDEFGESKKNDVPVNDFDPLITDPLISGFAIDPTTPNLYAFPKRYYIEFQVQHPIDANKVFTVKSQELNPELNPDAAVFLNPTNGTLEHGVDIQWSEMSDAWLKIPALTNPQELDNYDLSTRAFQVPITNPPTLSTGLPDTPFQIFFQEDEDKVNSPGLGFKFSLEFDMDNIEWPERRWTYSVVAKHIVHNSIFVHRPFSAGTTDPTAYPGGETSISLGAIQRTELPMNGIYYSLNRFNLDDGWYGDFLDGHFLKDQFYYMNFKDNVAANGWGIPILGPKYGLTDFEARKSWKAMETMDLRGFRWVVATTPRNSVQSQNPTTYDHPSFPENLSDLQNTPIFDNKMFEYGGISLSTENTDEWQQPTHRWGHKLFFTTTPFEIALGDQDPLVDQSVQKVSVTNSGIDFYYKPNNNKIDIDFYTLGKFAGQKERERFKQTLREAFNIAKWHWAIDNLGYPDQVFTATAPGQPGDVTRVVSNEYANLFGLQIDNAIDDNVPYWKVNQGLADYINIGVSHMVQFEISIFDNSGRGVKGELQPARIYPRRIGTPMDGQSSETHTREYNWMPVVGGDPYGKGGKVFGAGNTPLPSGTGPLLFGYDKVPNPDNSYGGRAFKFHATWIPGQEVRTQEDFVDGIRHGIGDLGIWPSRYGMADGPISQEAPWTIYWGAPFVVHAYEYDTNQTDHGGPNGLKMFYWNEAAGKGWSGPFGGMIGLNGGEDYEPVADYYHGHITDPGAWQATWTPRYDRLVYQPQPLEGSNFQHQQFPGGHQGYRNPTIPELPDSMGTQWHWYKLPAGYTFMDCSTLNRIIQRGTL